MSGKGYIRVDEHNKEITQVFILWALSLIALIILSTWFNGQHIERVKEETVKNLCDRVGGVLLHTPSVGDGDGLMCTCLDSKGNINHIFFVSDTPNSSVQGVGFQYISEPCSGGGVDGDANGE